MNLIYELVKSEIRKLDKGLCKATGVTEEGKKFSLLMLKKLSGYKNNKLKEFYCDGGGDHQIDGVYFVEDGDELQINIIFCVFRSGEKPIEDKDVSDLINNGLTYLLLGEERVPDLNDKIKKTKEAMDELRKEYEEKYIVTVKFISTADVVLSYNGENAFLKYQSELQSKNVNIDFEKINNKQISALFSSRTVLRTPMPIKLSGKSYYSLAGREGFVCRLPVQELLNIYFGFEDNGKKYQGYGDFLFEDNIRKNLGLKKKINSDIYDTATDINKATDFEYFNNGLTLIYDDKDGGLAGDSPVLYLKGLQVVNGCQTVNTLIKAHEDKKISEDIYVTCRFIKRSNDPQFIQSVITYTNSQNQISDRDLHANDLIQYTIQTILKNINIFYERKLNEFIDAEDNVRLDALDAAQAYLCCELQEPHRAKQDKRKLFTKLYFTIFDDSKADLTYRLLLSYRILYYVLKEQSQVLKSKQKRKKEGKIPRYHLKDLLIAHGSYHIAAILYKKLYEKSTSEDMQKYARKNACPDNIKEKHKEALSVLTKRIESKINEHKVEKEGLPQYFKSNESVDVIKDKQTQLFSQSSGSS